MKIRQDFGMPTPLLTIYKLHNRTFKTSKEKKIYCTFIDFSKAFDSVWQKLINSHINGKFLNVFQKPIS